MRIPTLFLAVAIAPAAGAGTFAEYPDAPPVFPGVPTMMGGGGPLDAIYGQFANPTDIDVYTVFIPVPAAFSATTVGYTANDTQLFLFSIAGAPITMNDDAVMATPGGSTITSAFIPGPGTYCIAVSQYPQDALNPGGLPIWDPTIGVEHAPDGPGAAGPLGFWTLPPAATGDYFIVFTGCMPQFAGPPSGPVVAETFDAPESTPGLFTFGTGLIARIVGQMTAPNDVDIYNVRINDPTLFSATVSAGTSTDSQLFLFDSTGNGVVHNDDNPAGGTLNSTLTGSFITSPAVYCLAISCWNRDAAAATGSLIWNDTPYNVERTPDGPGAGIPLSFWMNLGVNGGVYAINLEGAAFEDGPASDVQPSAMIVSPGIIVSGGMPEVLSPDDSRLVVRPGAVFVNTTPPVQVRLDGTSPTTSPNQLRIRFEGHASASNINMKTYAWNYTSNAYDEVDSRTLTIGDTSFVVNVPYPAQHVSGSNDIRIQFRCRATSAVFLFPWFFRLDAAGWTVVP